MKNDSLEVRVYDNGTKVEERNWTEDDIRAVFEIEIDLTIQKSRETLNPSANFMLNEIAPN